VSTSCLDETDVTVPRTDIGAFALVPGDGWTACAESVLEYSDRLQAKTINAAQMPEAMVVARTIVHFVMSVASL
jgi:hypothetical protein